MMKMIKEWGSWTHHYIKWYEKISFSDGFTNIMTLSERQSTSNLTFATNSSPWSWRAGKKDELTAVPVEGATEGSSASTSNERWIGRSRLGFTWSSAISTTLPIPNLSTWYIEKHLMSRNMTTMTRRVNYDSQNAKRKMWDLRYEARTELTVLF